MTIKRSSAHNSGSTSGSRKAMPRSQKATRSRAHQFYLEALQLEPKRADVHAKIAAAHHMIGNLPSALTSYDRALALDHSSAAIDVLRSAVDTAIAAADFRPRAAMGK